MPVVFSTRCTVEEKKENQQRGNWCLLIRNNND